MFPPLSLMWSWDPVSIRVKRYTGRPVCLDMKQGAMKELFLRLVVMFLDPIGSLVSTLLVSKLVSDQT